MMNREDRAKQFAPFEALTGLRDALRQGRLRGICFLIRGK